VSGEPSTSADYVYRLPITTRWQDNDMHGHVNNVLYYSFFDTVVTQWLITEARHDVRTADVIGLCVDSHCSFHAPLSFPGAVDGRLRVGHIGRSSVRYDIALFMEGSDECAATGEFVHVYVNRDDRRPCEIPARLREALERLGARSCRTVDSR
jgi:acyl-CoA thioester hydrolase